MSTSPPPPPPPAAGRRKLRGLFKYLFLAGGTEEEIVVISHSNLFYWWPVWLLAFIMAAWTYYEDHYQVVVPRGTTAAHDRLVQEEANDTSPEKMKKRDVLILKEGKPLKLKKGAEDDYDVEQPRIRMSPDRQPGVIFIIVLLLVIAVTNIPMRGLWSLLTIVVIVVWVIILAQLGFWEWLSRRPQRLSIYINMGGYLCIGIILFGLWLVGLFFFDRQFYVIVTPGLVRVHLEIGGGEKAYETNGMVFQKKRSDLFRHWVLGFGSGDLIIHPINSRENIDLPNVLFVGGRVRAIERCIKEKKIVVA